MRIWIARVSTLLACALAVGCAHYSAAKESYRYLDGADGAGTQIAPGYELTDKRTGYLGRSVATTDSEDEKTVPVSAGDPKSATRLRTYRGWFDIAVARPDLEGQWFVSRIEELNGFLAEKIDGNYRGRVPAQHFESFVEELRERGQVFSDRIEVDDVTEEVFDLEIRLDNAKKSRTRLLALLEKTDVVEEILQIEKELRRLTVEIESLEGRLRVLRNDVAYSTIWVMFRATDPIHDRADSASSFSWIRDLGVQPVIDIARKGGVR